MDEFTALFSRKDMTFEEAVAYFKERVPVTASRFYQIAAEYRALAFTVSGYTKAQVLKKFYDELLAALEAVEDKSGPVVRCNPNTIYHQINRVCARNGLPQVGTHGLRHSFASLGYHLGVPELEMMQLGGWADNQTMIRIYTHIANADRVKAENAMAGFFAQNANENANNN